MAINLTSDCEKCMHASMCKWKNNAKCDMERLKNTMYGDGPNDDYLWDDMMKSRNVNITFSCPDYRPEVSPYTSRLDGRNRINVC